MHLGFLGAAPYGQSPDFIEKADDSTVCSEPRHSGTKVLAKIKLSRLGQLDEVTRAIILPKVRKKLREILVSDASSLMPGAVRCQAAFLGRHPAPKRLSAIRRCLWGRPGVWYFSMPASESEI
jgi:hypothetical protein